MIINSKAVRQDQNKASEVSLVILYYDLSGFTEAMNRAGHFSHNPSVYLTCVHNFVFRSVCKIGTHHFDDVKLLGDGGVYFFVAKREVSHGELVQSLAKSAVDIVNRFPDWSRNALAQLCKDKFDGPNDIRITITTGPGIKFNSPLNKSGSRVFEYAGTAVNLGSKLLGMVKGGDVAVCHVYPPQKSIKLPFGFLRSGEKVKDFSGLKEVWNYHRTNRSKRKDPIPIRDTTIQELADAIYENKEKIREMLARYREPSNYATILEKLWHDRFLILRGEAGIGKTTTAYNLMAELLQEDRLQPRMPRIGRRTWSDLKKRPSDQLIYLDDPFGKWKLTPEGIDKSLRELDDFFCSEEGMIPRARVLITMRSKVFNDLREKWTQMGFTRELKSYDLNEEVYTGMKLDELFEDLTEQVQSTGEFKNFKALVDQVRIKIKRPMNVIDFARDIQTKRIDNSFIAAESAISRYVGDPRDRYCEEVTDASPDDQIFLFFARAFSNGFMDERLLEELFFQIVKIGTSPPSSIGQTRLWQMYARRWSHWFKWQKTGLCEWTHPLREEVLTAVFDKSSFALSVIERIYNRLVALTRHLEWEDKALRAAAYCVPLLGQLDPMQVKDVLKRILRSRDDGVLAVLADSIGRFIKGGDTKHPAWDIFLQTLIDLISIKTRPLVIAATLMAVCDNYVNDEKMWPQKLRKALQEVAEKGPDTAKEQLAWAISSNFERLPKDLRKLLFKIVRGGKRTMEAQWVKLRGAEAIADYYEVLEQEIGNRPNELKRYETLVYSLAQDIKEHALVRRGVVGAIEANFEELPNPGDALIPLADERSNLGVLEWVIWACGERLKDLIERKNIGNDILEAFKRLALHEDLRVRKWVAEALSDNLDKISRDSHARGELLELLTKLAVDRSDHVRNSAAEFFWKDE